MKTVFMFVFLLIAWKSHATVAGPLQHSFYATKIYHDEGDGLYIEFQNGSMPGCSNSKGGRLSHQNANYKELYALILTITASKGFSGHVRYTETSTNGWWHCSIQGIWAFPK